MSDYSSEASVLQTVSQGRRRQLVLQMYLSLAAVTLVFGFARADWWFVLALAPMLYAFALYAKLVTPVVKEVTAKEDVELDERQLAVRNHAYHRAYRILGIAFMLVIVYAMFASSFTEANLPVPRTFTDYSLLIVFFAHLTVSLPASVVAWTEPDPPIWEEY